MIQETQFIHSVSKGSKFNQIYIPQDMKQIFEVGDIVEVKLVEKKNKIVYSKNLEKLSYFKEEIIKKVFSLSNKLKEINQILIFGSFLTSKNEYHDIDIILISNKKEIDSEFYNLLNKHFDLKFHIISIEESKFNELIRICPLTRSMLYYYISNKKLEDLPKRVLDKKYIQFLLMLPEDLIEVELNSRMFYDSLRKLIVIENFINNQDSDSLKIDTYLEKELDKYLIKKIKSDKSINNIELKKIREFIKFKLNKLKNMIEDE